MASIDKICIVTKESYEKMKKENMIKEQIEFIFRTDSIEINATKLENIMGKELLKQAVKEKLIIKDYKILVKQNDNADTFANLQITYRSWFNILHPDSFVIENGLITEKYSQKIFNQLVDCSIINKNGYLVMHQITQIEEALKKHFPSTYAHEKIFSIFKQRLMYSLEFAQLFEMKQYEQFNLSSVDLRIPNKPQKQLFEALVKLGYICTDEKIQIKPLKKANQNFIESIVQNIQDVVKDPFKKFFHQKIDTLIQKDRLFNEAQDKIIETLTSKVGYYWQVSTPYARFEPLSQRFTTSTYQMKAELDMFSTNAFDHIIVISEKPFSLKMIVGTLSVIVLGICEIALAVYIEIQTCGWATYAAQGLFSEGIGDLIYGVQCLFSGNFNLNAYVHQKAISMGISILTAGIGIYFSKGVQVSKYGVEIGKQIGNPTVYSKLAGKELFQQVGKNVVVKQAITGVFKEVGKQIVYFGVSKGVDYVIDQAMQKIFEGIQQTIRKTVLKQFRENKTLQSNIFQLFKQNGEEQALKTIKLLGNEAFKETSMQKNYNNAKNCIFKSAKIIVDGISQGLSTKDVSQNDTLSFTLGTCKVINMILKYIEIPVVVAEVSLASCFHIERLNQSIQQNVNANCQNQSMVMKDKFDQRVEQLQYEWASQLSQNIIIRIKNEIAKPSLNKSLQSVIEKLGKTINDIYDNTEFAKNRKINRQKDLLQIINENNDAIYSDIESFKKQQQQEKLPQYQNKVKGYSEAALEAHENIKQYVVDIFASQVENGRLGDIFTISTIAKLKKQSIVIENVKGEVIDVFDDQGNQVSDKKQIEAIKSSCNHASLIMTEHENGNKHYSSQKNPSHQAGDNRIDCVYSSMLIECGFNGSHQEILDLRSEIAQSIKDDPQESWLIVKNFYPNLGMNDLLEQGGGYKFDKEYKQIENQIISMDRAIERVELMMRTQEETISKCQNQSGRHRETSKYSKRGLINSDHIPPFSVYSFAKNKEIAEKYIKILKQPNQALRLGQGDLPAITIPEKFHKCLLTSGLNCKELRERQQEHFKNGEYHKGILLSLLDYRSLESRLGPDEFKVDITAIEKVLDIHQNEFMLINQNERVQILSRMNDPTEIRQFQEQFSQGFSTQSSLINKNYLANLNQK